MKDADVDDSDSPMTCMMVFVSTGILMNWPMLSRDMVSRMSEGIPSIFQNNLYLISLGVECHK